MNHTERTELVAGFDAVLEDLVSIEDALNASETGRWATDLRRTLSEMGFFDLALPQSVRGLALDMRTLASLCIATGYRLLPPSLVFESLVLAPTLETAGGEHTSQLEDLRSGLLAGGGCLLDSDCNGGSFASDLRMSVSPEAAIACVITSDDRAAVVNLEATRVRSLTATDLLSRRIQLDLSPEPLIQLDRSVRHNWLVGSLADCIGAASAALDMAVEYSQERQQFGQPLFRFQAISHRLADMKADLELALAGLSRLIYLAETDSKTFNAFLTSLLHAVPSHARRVCEGAIQVHGGIGFTWEAGIHLYYRRVLQIQAHLGGTQRTARRVGALSFADSADGHALKQKLA